MHTFGAPAVWSAFFMRMGSVMVLTLGRSVEGRPIDAYARGDGDGPLILVLGGVHGDEPKGVLIARRLIDHLDAEPPAGGDTRWLIVPVVNPDGYELRRRRNARKVDINRNFPTANWSETSKRSRMYGGNEPASEPETRAVMSAVEHSCPAAIIAVHSIGEHKHCNNYDGPGQAMAEIMQSHNAYPVHSSIGYATPGSLGTWAGIERNMPTVTLELPSHHSPKRCWQDNRRAVLACGEVISGQLCPCSTLE